MKAQMKKQILTAAFTLTIMVISAFQLLSQNASNLGKEFYVAFGKNDDKTSIVYGYNASVGKSCNNVELILRITALVETEVKLEFTNDPSLNETIMVAAGEIRDYSLDANRGNAAYSGVNGNNKKSIHVTASNPITLLALSSTTSSAEAASVFPVEKYGTEYVHVGLNPYGSSHSNGFLVIATENNTKIDFISSNNYPSSFSTTLDKGGVYHYSATGSNNHPLGMKISSTKPVAYFQSGTQVQNKSPQGAYFFNHAYEQIPPVNQWGTKFIMPTNQVNAGFVRLYSKEKTNVTITYYPSGFTTTTEFFGFKDIKIDRDNQRNDLTCYIVASAPVSACTYNTPHYYEMEQPGVSWLPSLEQSVSSVLVSPFDFNSAHVWMEVNHYAYIMVPTNSKDNTTISINGETPQSIQTLSDFKWIGHDIGGSGYSYGKYYFGKSQSGKINLNQKVLISNPDGMIALMYGEGNYTCYYYSAGDAGRSLDMAFYINAIHFEEINGLTICGVVYEITALSNLPNSQGASYPKWYFNGEEDTDLKGQGLVGHSSTELFTKILMPGTYTVKMEFLDENNKIKECETTFTVATEPKINTSRLAELCDNGYFNPNLPEVTGGSSLVADWQLETAVGSDEYNKISVPYTVSLSDNGKRVRYYVKNNCGDAYSDPQTIVVNPNVTPSVKISVTY